MDYNLLHEPWIPVLYRTGRLDRVGILGALADASRIRQVAASNPMDRMAVLRLLLAIVYWCKGNPPEHSGPPHDQNLPMEWFSRLTESTACFSLFGDTKRFAQFLEPTARLAKPHSATYLLQEIPTGNNSWHFRHVTDNHEGVCPACCALGLIRLPLFSTSAGTGYSYGINGKPPFYVAPVGTSLRESLRLSWKNVSVIGAPGWESSNPRLPTDVDVPLLTGFTCQPRQVWLNTPEEDGQCIGCGQTAALVRTCLYGGLGSSKTEGPGREWRDPFVVYVHVRNTLVALQPSDARSSHDAAAGQWTRLLGGVLPSHSDCPYERWCVGFSTVNNDTLLEAREWRIPPASPAGSENAPTAKLEQWRKEAARLPHRLRAVNQRRTSLKHPEIEQILANIRPHIEHRVASKAHEYLTGGDTAWQSAADEYRPMMQAIAGSLAPGVTATAVERRRQIARILPDMGPRKEPAAKSKRKTKGANA